MHGRAIAILGLLAGALEAGCEGVYTGSAAAMSVEVSPPSTSVAPGGTATFSASVTGAISGASTAVAWSVQEFGGGTVDSSGKYIAPGGTGTFHVVATSVADASRTAAATVAVAANTATWEPLRVGAGGWLVGMTVQGYPAAAPTSAVYLVRADTYGAYVSDGTTAWKQLVTSTSMPAAFISSFTTGTVQSPGEGVYEIVVAPTNPNLLYMFYKKKIFKSADQGTTWTQTAFSYTGTADPNGPYRYWGERMAVDPANANVVYVGTETDGLYVTTNGGTSWSLVSGVGVPGAQGITGIVFDPNSGTTGGKTNKIWATRNGTGVYASTDAGATWNLLAGSPTTTTHAAVATDGEYYAVNMINVVHRYVGGAWSDSASIGTGVTLHSVACDPFNAARIIVGTDGGYLGISTDRGTTWLTGGLIYGPGTALRVATDIPWLADGHANENYMSNGAMRFDPVTSNKLWFSQGIGVWHSDQPDNTTRTTWTSFSLGIEQLVARDITAPPGGPNVITAGLDRSVWVLPKANTSYPSDYVKMGSTASLINGWAVNYSAANSAHLVAIINYGPELSGYSLDNGATWTKFPAQPGTGGVSGDVVLSTIDNIVAVIGNKGLYRSTDRGTSWTQITPLGASTAQNLHGGYNNYKHPLAIDGVTPTTMYLYWYGAGVYKSTDSGANWTLVHNDTGFDAVNMFWHTKLRSVPGQAGHLFMTAGQAGSDGQQNPAATRLWRSTDGGANWSAVTGIGEPYDVALGMAAPGQSYPAIYVVGWYNNVYGIWRSIDNAATWSQIGPFPFGDIDLIVAMKASQDTYGDVYVGFQGSGWGHGIVH